MRAMVLDQPGQKLKLKEVPEPAQGENQVLIRVMVCGICRTDLHVVDGDLTDPRLPIIPGHQIVGRVEAIGEGVTSISVGERVGVPWLGGSCGKCSFCQSGRENLCDHARYTGYQIDGGFAEFCISDERFCFPIPEDYPDLQAAPLLCAGLIGYRSLCMAGEGHRLGFYGFGAAAHILIQVARYQGREVYAFTRHGDTEKTKFAKSLGAVWAGFSDQLPPEKLDAAIIFAPAGELVPIALKAIDKGGKVVCAGIHMSDIPSFPYSYLWEEREICSVANLTRRDGEEFLSLAPKVPIKTEVHPYPLEKTNEALDDLRNGRFNGAAVIVVDNAVTGL
ncbi:MAG: alcohol dehydrogenase [Candidatus Zixiibacteriota bacterium]|nr:MAG: alcohol dehydrogenase [candidate division Zixibacteria bacterium]